MLNRVRRHLARHGLAATLLRIAIRLLNSVVAVLVLRVLVLPRGACERAATVGQGDWGFRSRDELQRLCEGGPTLDLDSEFVAEAFARGDQCFAFVEHGALKAYAWYSTSWAPLRDRVRVACSPGYVYMYKAFTAPDERGRGLYRTGVAKAELAVREQPQFKGFIACVETHNRASLEPLEKIGFITAGRCAILGKRPSFVHVSDSCRKLLTLKIDPAELRGGEGRWSPGSIIARRR